MKNSNRRVPSDQLVSSGLVVLKKGDPLISKMNPNKIIVVDSEKYSSLVASAANQFPYESLEVSAVSDEFVDANKKDAPDLTDITVYTQLTRKREAATNKIYYEIVFKVRNSSERMKDVVGVDARIVGTEPQND